MTGNAQKVKNTYLTDLVEVYLPRKYFFCACKPTKCHVEIKTGFFASQVSGVELPQGTCYPLNRVRSYIYKDIFWPLSKVTDFFTAYNLSYLFSLVFIYLTAVFFFGVFLGEAPLATVLCTALLTTS